MAPDDEERDEADSDIPSFEDLVEEVDRRKQASTDEGASDEPAPTTPEDVPAESESADDDEEWDWGGKQDSSANEGSDSHEGGVDTLWDEEEAETAAVSSDDRFDLSKIGAVIELVEDAPNLLLVGPKGVPIEHDVCSRLCDAGTSGTRNRILVTTDTGPHERLDELSPYTEEPYDNTIIIVVGEQSSSKDTGDSFTRRNGEESVVVERLSDPSDLTRLGVLVNKYLGNTDPPPVVCFHSINGLLQFVGLEKLFRFLHIHQARVRSVNGRAHYKLDPNSVDDETVSTLRPLFDYTVWYEADGSISVKDRG